ncbi:MAG: membrane protease YdiL (CAAX protease family) [Myxococcota bacterium]
MLLLGALTVGVVLMWTTTSQRRNAPPSVSISDYRSIEEYGIIYDASARYPTAVQDIIGLAGNAASTPEAVVDAAQRKAAAAPWSDDYQVVLLALAVALEVDATATHVATELLHEPDPKRTAEVAATLRTLASIAAGEHVDLAGVGLHLKRIGTTRWLPTRLEAANLRNRDGREGGNSLRARASELATGYVDTYMTSTFVQLGLLLLGLIVLLTSVLWRRALARRGFAGLKGSTSRFDLNQTTRVVAGWFLLFVFAGQAIATAGAAAGSSPRTQVMFGALTTLAHGIIGVVLIYTLARQEDGVQPLAKAFGLSAKPLPRRWLGLALGLVPGIAFAAFVTEGAFALNTLLFGEPTAPQTTLDLLIRDPSGPTMMLVGLSAVVLAPLAEELIFRGFLYRNLRDRLGPAAGLFVSGAVFGAVHLDPERIIPLTALGVVFGLLYEWTGSLLVPIAVHAVWNFLNLLSVYAIYQAA